MTYQAAFLPPLAATSQSRGRELAALAFRQHGTAARAQLLALGFSRHAIQHLLDIGYLHPLWPGVYAIGHRRLTWKGRCMAGVLACGDEALLGERSAGGLLGIFRLRSGPVHVMAPAWRRSRPGLRVHGSENIGRYRVVVEGIPATSVARTLLALAASLRRDELARAVEESERLRLFDLVAVDEVLAAHPGARGSHRLRQALDGYREIPAWSRSAFEDEFLRQLLRARLPLPAVNNWVAGHEVDCVWFEQKLAVELDGGGYHSTTAARERDPQRDADLQIAGFALLRVTDRRLARDPAGVMANVRRLLARR